MLKHNRKKRSRACEAIGEQQAADKTDGDSLPMKGCAVIGKKDGMHRSEERCVDEDGKRTRAVQGGRISIKEQHAIEQLLGRDGEERIKRDHEQPKWPIQTWKG